LIGVDVSEAAVEVATRELGGIARFIAGTAAAVPAADVVICSNVLEHLDNDLEVVEQLRARCRTLFVVVPFNEEVVPGGEHVRAYSRASFAGLGVRRMVVFQSKGWTQFGWNLVYGVWLKNLLRPLFGRPKIRRGLQALYEIPGYRP
jgi:2-polyprenyl-3-methyl-5-hydroxy-6-metoxy-1,4-benzoquinol methylase